MYQRARFLPAGDKAVSIELGGSISPEINRKVRALLLAIEKESMSEVIDLVPTYRSILAYYDPLRITLSELEERLSVLEQRLDEAPGKPPKVIEIPTMYGGEYGPDLDYVAQHNGLTPEQVMQVHSDINYQVYMMGFTPGFPYLGEVSEKIATPRLQTPRTAIPAGSVGIAERQTGVYPTESPGGWRIIGRTPIQLFDARRDPPAVVEVGDHVRFTPITEDTFQDIERQVRAGSYRLTARAAE